MLIPYHNCLICLTDQRNSSSAVQSKPNWQRTLSEYLLAVVEGQVEVDILIVGS
jgi:hypothetical protein